MEKIWIIRYKDGTAEVFDSEQNSLALPYVDAFEAEQRIAELEGQVEHFKGQVFDEQLDHMCSILDAITQTNALALRLTEKKNQRIAELEAEVSKLAYKCSKKL